MWGTKSASYNLCVFDLGEQIVNSNECCNEVVKIKTRSEGGDGGKISCMANHGGKNCSNAFGINNGRCTFNPNVCMCQFSPEVIATQRWGVENVGMK